MNSLAQKENARTLAAAIGVSDDEAEHLLNVCVVITSADDSASAAIAKHIFLILSATVTNVVSEIPESPISAEIVIGRSLPRCGVPQIYVSVGDEKIIVSRGACDGSEGRTHPVGLLAGACYAAALTVQTILGDRLPFSTQDTICFDLKAIVGHDLSLLYEHVQFGHTFLAGAGAIGNGFIYALQFFDASGSLEIVDDDVVSGGNLQRCILFSAGDIGEPKATKLAEVAKRLLPNVYPSAQTVRLQNVAQKSSGPWLRRLVVAVDSPRARRSLQSEVPGEVYDASTTDIREIVLHFNKQPTDKACMSCVYHQTPEENAHVRHVAETLGVSVSEVAETRISAAAAERIYARYPNLRSTPIEGVAYDTLFKQLCAGARLKVEDRQVLTPFAFVSVLAGTLLAIEFVRRSFMGDHSLFNEWRISPWANPVIRRRRLLSNRVDCEFCGNPTLAEIAKKMWEEANEKEKISKQPRPAALSV
jgi:hypothetical protein